MTTTSINLFAASTRFTATQRSVRVESRIWGYDPRWMRLEAFDEKGDSLGLVWFESVAMENESVQAA